MFPLAARKSNFRLRRWRAQFRGKTSLKGRTGQGGKTDLGWPDASPRSRSMATGFSLLEVIIATAALAGSAMVLISLLGLGSKFGSRAEYKTLAMCRAESILDEAIATSLLDEDTQEITDNIGGRWPMSYRITVTPFQMKAVGNAGPNNLRLQRITVEVFESESQMAEGSSGPLCKVTRLIRNHQASGSDRSENSSASSLNDRQSMDDLPLAPAAPGPQSTGGFPR